MKEVEISIKGLIFYILRHWKSIIVVMLIAAVTLSGLQMVKKSRSNNNTILSETPEASLTDSERAYVESVVEYLNGLHGVNKNREDSIILNLNSDKVIKIELTYMISVDDSECLEGVEQAYRNYLTGSGFIGFISDEVGVDDPYFSETISVSYERSRTVASDTVIKIIAVSDDYSHIEKIANAVEDYVKDKSSELSTNGFAHRLLKIGDSTYEGPDLSIQNRQVQLLQDMQSINRAVLDTENSLSGAQKEYYEKLICETEKDDEASNETIITGKESSVRPSVKYILLGLIIGAVLMCGLYFLLYVIGNKLDVEDDVEGMFDTYLIGVLPGKDYGKLVYKLQHLGKRSFDFEESIKLISTRIKMLVRKSGAAKIGIIGCGIKKSNEKAAKVIADALNEDGFEVVVIDDFLYEPVNAEKLPCIDRAILLEKAGETYRSEIWKELEEIKKLGIKTEGIVIAE